MVCLHIPFQKLLTVNRVLTAVKIYIIGGKNERKKAGKPARNKINPCEKE